MPDPSQLSLESVLPALRARATENDRNGIWPADDLIDLRRAGAFGWFIPQRFGGGAIDPLALHLRYEQIASASLATALVLSQRDSAVGLIDGSDSEDLKSLLLSKMSTGECFATIGIAQLTTSRQGAKPALRATPTETGYQLDGFIPWSTSPAKAQYVIAGAVLDDSSQILFALPTDLPGVSIAPPLPLVALSASWTSQIDCHAVKLDRKWILRGPAPKALAGRSRTIPIGQAFLAFGLCRGGLDLIAAHDSARARATAFRLDSQLQTLRQQVIDLNQPGRETEAITAGPRLRGACNDLAVRISHAAVALYKGTALRLDHPAQRLAREAMFLLVWSCPDPVIECTLEELGRQSK